MHAFLYWKEGVYNIFITFFTEHMFGVKMELFPAFTMQLIIIYGIMGGVAVRIEEIEKRQKELLNMVDTLAEKKNKSFIEIKAFNINKRRQQKDKTSNM